jgi:L-ribulose-5-phosphate 3-epimerase
VRDGAEFDMRLGYNTNGLAFHRWPGVLELLAETGYQAVGITVDVHCLNPFAPDYRRELDETQHALERVAFRSVIETGARFLLDPRKKHDPTILAATAGERRVRIDFLKSCIDAAKVLNSDAVSFWSGILRDEISRDAAMARLVAGCREVADYADERGMTLAFEPEPGMFIETLADYEELSDRVGAECFGLTIDVGHVQCVEAGSIASHLVRWKDRLRNIHIEDMRRGVHEHLMFGEGEIDFPPVLQALAQIGYQHGVYVELSRHSHMAVEALQRSFDFLNGILRTQRPPGA